MEEKAKKRRQIDERKYICATAREVKLAKQAKKRLEKDEERLTRAANKQLQTDIKQIQQSKEKVIQPTVIENKEDNNAVSPIEVVVSEYRVTERGRKVTLPQRFCT